MAFFVHLPSFFSLKISPPHLLLHLISRVSLHSICFCQADCQTGATVKYQVKNTLLAHSLTVYSRTVFLNKIYPGILESWNLESNSNIFTFCLSQFFFLVLPKSNTFTCYQSQIFSLVSTILKYFYLAGIVLDLVRFWLQ